MISSNEDDEIHRAYRTHWAEEECMQNFGGKIRSKETTRKT
jgi:hypothetical protein